MCPTKTLDEPQFRTSASKKISLQELIELIAVDDKIPQKRRNELCSGVRTLCRALDLQPASSPADPRLIADRLRHLTPTAARLSKRRLHNCRSYVDAALSLVDTRYRRRRSLAALAPELAALLVSIDDRWQRAKLRRFFHHLGENGLGPGSVDEETFDSFRAGLDHSLVEDVRTVDREARKIWNALVAKTPHLGWRQVTLPSYTDHYVLAETAFPNTLWLDVDAYLASRATKEEAVIDDLLTEEELFGTEKDGPTAPLIRPSTSKLIRYRVRQFSSALVLSEVFKADDVTSLKPLVAPKVVAAGLNFFIKRNDGVRRNSQIRGMAYDLLMIARLWVRSPESELRTLEEIAVKVRPEEEEGLPEATRRKLAPFRDIHNVLAFLALPDRVFKEAQSSKAVDRETANRVATALWIRIAQRAPPRITNLLSTSLTTNLLRSHAGKDATVALFYPPGQVKNKKALEIPLSAGTAKLLNHFLTVYRPALMDTPSDWIFPAPDGGHKRASVMSDDIQKLMREMLGFAINPHVFRHLAAKLYLTAYPGRYRDAQLLLGHRSLETTVKYYVDLDAEEAFRHFDAVLLRLEETGTLRTRV